MPLDKQVKHRVACAVSGLATAGLAALLFNLGYLFGPLAFDPARRQPPCALDMFLYRDYFIVICLILASAATAILSFAAVVRPTRKLFSWIASGYIVVFVLFLLQNIWGAALRLLR